MQIVTSRKPEKIDIMHLCERIVDILLDARPSLDVPSPEELTGAYIASKYFDRFAGLDDESFGFSIYTTDEYVIRDNAAESKIKLTNQSWKILNHDIDILERNIIEILRKNGLSVRPEGHDDNSLNGSAWINLKTNKMGYKVPSYSALDLVYYGSTIEIGTGNGNLNYYVKADDEEIWKGVSVLGQKLLDVSVHFALSANLSNKIEDLGDWAKEHRKMLEAKKQWLDFNQVIGVEQPSGVYVKNIDNVRIYSARCPGCKRIHGNFRTWEEASGNKQCKFCNRDYVDMMQKAHETGNFKPLLKEQ